jgi:2-methylcitrate dehydratase PrpD
MPVLAAVIAAGDKLGVAEHEAIAAASIGIEAAMRIFVAVDSEEFRARWSVASSVGLLGAVLAVARLLQLDETHTRHALGIAATQAAGLAHNADHAMEAIEIGKAAMRHRHWRLAVRAAPLTRCTVVTGGIAMRSAALRTIRFLIA